MRDAAAPGSQSIRQIYRSLPGMRDLYSSLIKHRVRAMSNKSLIMGHACIISSVHSRCVRLCCVLPVSPCHNQPFHEIRTVAASGYPRVYQLFQAEELWHKGCLPSHLDPRFLARHDSMPGILFMASLRLRTSSSITSKVARVVSSDSL